MKVGVKGEREYGRGRWGGRINREGERYIELEVKGGEGRGEREPMGHTLVFLGLSTRIANNISTQANITMNK